MHVHHPGRDQLQAVGGLKVLDPVRLTGANWLTELNKNEMPQFTNVISG